MRAPAGTLLRAGLALILGLALVSCTDDPKPGTVGTPTATPSSSTPSPTPSTPEAQIEAAVRAYYAELTKAAQTNDTSELTRDAFTPRVALASAPCAASNERAPRADDSGCLAGTTESHPSA